MLRNPLKMLRNPFLRAKMNYLLLKNWIGIAEKKRLSNTDYSINAYYFKALDLLSIY